MLRALPRAVSDDGLSRAKKAASSSRSSSSAACLFSSSRGLSAMLNSGSKSQFVSADKNNCDNIGPQYDQTNYPQRTRDSGRSPAENVEAETGRPRQLQRREYRLRCQGGLHFDRTLGISEDNHRCQ